ncbi:MAG: hypothetical protein HY062_04085, partial [Bacteroidetes bacterium]|nr:hypothetical protein [Bacteroidota bacterium]
MKKFLTSLFAITSLFMAAQSQLGINYQSIIRNNSGTVMASTPVTVEFKLYSTATLTNVLLYHESHSTTTNQFGMANLVIGQGTVVGGVVSFSNVPWPAGISYEVYVNSNLVGSRQPFVSVPYALAAAYAPAPTVTFSNNILSVGGNTATIPAGTTYTAGTGINVTGNTITNTAPDRTVTITPAGSASVTGVYPNFTITTPTTQIYSAGTGIDISSSGVISNTATAITPTLTAGNNITINPTTPGNSYTVSAPSYSLSQSGNNIELLQNGTSIGTATLPIITNYTAGNGIDISGGVISNTLVPVTPTLSVTGNSISISPGNTQALPSYSLTQSGSNIDLTQNGTSIATVSLAASSSTSLSAGSSNIILNQSGNAYTITPVIPTFTNSGPTTITGTYPNYTVNSVAGATTTLVQGNNITLNQSGNTYTVSAPAYSISLPGGNVAQITNGISTSTAPIAATNLTLNGANNNVLSAGGNTVGLNTFSAGTGISITGSAPNYTINNNSPATTPTITGTGNAIVTPSGNTFTVNVPTQTLSVTGNSVVTSSLGGSATFSPAVLSYTGNTNTLKINDGVTSNTVLLNSYSAGTGISISGSAPNFVITNTAVITTPTISGTGLAVVSPTVGNNFTVNVPTPLYNPTSGILGFGTNTVVVTPTLSLTGTTLTSGASTNSVNLALLPSVWSNSVGVLYPTTLTNSVGIGTNGPVSGRLEILHSATATSPHINVVSPSGVYGRVKYSNSGQANYFSTEYVNDGSGINEAFSINQYNGTNSKPVFLINGQRMAYVNALNYPLAAFHVMTSAATAQGGIASEGFAQSGQLNLTRNNNAGAGSRTAVFNGDEIGKINFSGYDGSTFGDGAKIYAKATENVTGSNKGTELTFAAVSTGTNVAKDVFKINGIGNLEIISGLQIPAGAAGNKVLTSDAVGYASWQSLSSLGTAWTSTLGATTLTNITDKVGIGTTTPNNVFQVKDYITFESLGSNTSLGYLTGLGTTPNNYYNTFTGYYAGQAVGTGTASGNSFYGYRSGTNSVNGTANSFFGANSGQSNTNGSFNSFIGNGAGSANTQGDNNTAIGYNAGLNNITGRTNTFIGSGADLYSATQYTNAAAVGYNSKVDANDALVLGNSVTNVGIGTSQPSSPLHVVNYTGSQIKMGNSNQQNLEWYWDVDPSSNLYLRNEGGGTTQTRLYFDYNSGHLGLGAGAPGYKLTVVGGAGDDLATIYAVNNSTSTTTASHGIHGLTASSYSLSAGVFGNNSSVGPSILGIKNSTQTGIAGRFDILNASNSADAVLSKTE